MPIARAFLKILGSIFFANILISEKEKGSALKIGGHRQSWVEIFGGPPREGYPPKNVNLFLSALLLMDK